MNEIQINASSSNSTREEFSSILQQLKMPKIPVNTSSNSKLFREEIKRMEEQIHEEFRRFQEMADNWKDITNNMDKKENSTFAEKANSSTEKIFNFRNKRQNFYFIKKCFETQEETITEKTSTEERYVQSYCKKYTRIG